MLLSQPGARRTPCRQASASRLWSRYGKCGSVVLPALLPRTFGHSNRLVLRNIPSISTRLFAATSMFSKFSDQSLRIVTLSQQQARWLGYTEVGTEHLLLGLIAHDQERPGLFGHTVMLHRARETVQKVSGLRKGSLGKSEVPPFTRNARAAFESALTECQVMGMRQVTPEHLVLAMCNTTHTGCIRALHELGVHIDAVRREARRRIQMKHESAAKKNVASERAKASKTDLSSFCRDLTSAATAGEIDPVVGRAEEVRRVCQILARRRKNNPLLLGEAGVGKTAVAEGLARLIATNGTIAGAPLPEWLQGARVLQLDIALLLAGTKERGEVEGRVRKLIAAVEACPRRTVLFIDELHAAAGAGAATSAGGAGLDLSSLLKPALARGALRCMAATTPGEFIRRVHGDTTLTRCFQPVQVNEPTPQEAETVLRGLASRYEAHHQVSYTEEAIAAAVALSVQHIPDRHLPDKALDLLDEAGSRARMAAYAARAAEASPQHVDRHLELSQVLEAKDEAVAEARFEEAALLRDRELDLKAALVAPAEQAPRIALVDTPAIEQVVAAWTSIPVERLSQTEAKRLRRLPAQLSAEVVGQDAAVSAAARAVQRARVGLKDPSRPQAALLFAGPTGVGKTSLCTALSEHLASRDALVRLDMGEFMERHSVSKLLGAPPGYVGFGEGGLLTEAVRRRPHSVVLFDEIEKAHPDVFNVLLQVLEDGRLTDSAGRTVSFRQCLIVLTSNVGSQLLAKGAHGLGFALDDAAASAGERTRSLVLGELKVHFRPEFLNRLDEIVVFQPLAQESLLRIAGKLLAEVVDRVAQCGVTLRVAAGVADLVCAHGVSAEQGARQLRRTITALLEDPLTDRLLQEEEGAVEEVSAEVEEGRVVLSVTRKPLSPVKTGQGIQLLDLPFVPTVFAGRRPTVKANA
eukprot:jgi/Ulvmu1/10312/UM060_0114.1